MIIESLCSDTDRCLCSFDLPSFDGIFNFASFALAYSSLRLCFSFSKLFRFSLWLSFSSFLIFSSFRIFSSTKMFSSFLDFSSLFLRFKSFSPSSESEELVSSIFEEVCFFKLGFLFSKSSSSLSASEFSSEVSRILRLCFVTFSLLSFTLRFREKEEKCDFFGDFLCNFFVDDVVVLSPD